MKARIPNQGPTGANMMKKLQEMQSNMESLQAELAVAEYSASAGGGAVDVTVNGSHEIKAIHIKPEVVDPEETDMLEKKGFSEVVLRKDLFGKDRMIRAIKNG